MKKLALFLVLTLFASSCTVVRQSKTTTVKETNDTTRTRIEIVDTVTLQVTDTVRSTFVEVAKEFSYDSLNLELSIKDNKIRQLVRQLANKTFSTDTVHAHSKYAHAMAAVTNNNLWVELELDSISYINKFVTDSTLVRTTIDTTIDTVETKEETIWTNPWFYASAFLGLLCVAFIVTLILVILRR